jgi:hypothetical protein
LKDELGIYDGAKAHDIGFLKMCIEKLERSHFTLDDIIRKNLDRKYIIYAYFGASRKAPPLEDRIKLLQFAFLRMIDEGLLRRDRWGIDGLVHYSITTEL